jgi:hypothetical protein
MKVIFLDIDGVLNSQNFIHSFNGKWELHSVDPNAINVLNEIIKATNAKIVISSSWRIILDLNEIKDILIENGFVGEIIGKTPIIRDNNRCRGDEINAYLEANPNIDKFIILDDDSDMDNLIDRLVKTSYIDGLLPKHIEKAISLLG